MALRLAIRPVVTFKTSKGSQYWLDEKGRSQRFKSYHPEHGVEDQGLKKLYDNIIFVDDSVAHQLLYATGYRSNWRIIIRNGKVGVAKLGSNNKLHYISGPFDFSNKPSIGFAPIEIENLKYSKRIQGYYVKGKYHIGNVIVGLKYIDSD